MKFMMVQIWDNIIEAIIVALMIIICNKWLQQHVEFMTVTVEMMVTKTAAPVDE
jgi:hypothetical protein